MGDHGTGWDVMGHHGIIMDDLPSHASQSRPGVNSNPDLVTTVTDLGQELRNLRISVGNPSLRELSRRAHESGNYLPHSTAGNAQSGKILPGLDVVLAFAHACGVAPPAMKSWKAAWQRASASRDRLLREYSHSLPASGATTGPLSATSTSTDRLPALSPERLAELEPKRAARLLESLDPSKAANLLTALGPEAAIELLANMETRAAANVLESMDTKRAAGLLDIMAPLLAIDLLGFIDDTSVVADLLKLMDAQQAAKLLDKLGTRASDVLVKMGLTRATELLRCVNLERCTELLIETLPDLDPSLDPAWATRLMKDRGPMYVIEMLLDMQPKRLLSS